MKRGRKISKIQRNLIFILGAVFLMELFLIVGDSLTGNAVSRTLDNLLEENEILQDKSVKGAVCYNILDYGLDIDTFGFTSGFDDSGEEYEWEDLCLDGNSLNETYCEGNYPEYLIFDCVEEGFLAGCQPNGRCEPLPEQYCDDSDNDELDVAGTISGNFQGVFDMDDSCYDSTHVIEMSCRWDIKPESLIYDCRDFFGEDAICENGKCAGTSPCIDTDRGFYLNRIGRTYGKYSEDQEFSFLDVCVDGIRINESGCVGNNPEVRTYDCNGYGYEKCFYGICSNDEFQSRCGDSNCVADQCHGYLFASPFNYYLNGWICPDNGYFSLTDSDEYGAEIFFSDGINSENYLLKYGEEAVLPSNSILKLKNEKFIETETATNTGLTNYIKVKIHGNEYILNAGENYQIEGFANLSYHHNTFCSPVEENPLDDKIFALAQGLEEEELSYYFSRIKEGDIIEKFYTPIEILEINHQGTDCIINQNNHGVYINVGENPYCCPEDCGGCDSDRDCESYSEAYYYCQDNKVYTKEKRSCVNPGTPESYCSITGQDVLLQDCGSNGECIEGLRCCKKEPESFFPIMVWGNPSQEIFNELGLNTIMTVRGKPNWDIVQEKGLFDAADELGLKVEYAIPDYLRDKRTITKESINSFCSHDSFLAYGIGDEPPIQEVPMYAEVYQGINSLDSNLIYTNIHSNRVIDSFIKKTNTKVLVVDPYSIQLSTPYQNENPEEYDKVISNHARLLSKANLIAKEKNIPLWVTVQAHEIIINEEERPLLTEEYRLLNYLSLVYGAKGISQYALETFPPTLGDDGTSYGGLGLLQEDGTKTEKYYELKDFYEKLNIISPILLNLTSKGSCNSRYINLELNTENKILNGNFEDVTGGNILNWGDSDDSLELISGEENCHSGNYCVKSIKANWGFRQNIPLEAGKNYEVSFLAKTNPQKDPSEFRILIGDANNYHWMSCWDKVYELEGGWIEYSCFFKSPEAVNNPRVTIMSGTDPFDAESFSLIDDISIREANPGGKDCSIPIIDNSNGNIEIGYFKDNKNRNYFMFVNRDTINQAATDVSIKAPEISSVFLKDEISGNIKRIETANEKAVIQEYLEPGEGKLYGLGFCGDLNSDGSIKVADITFLIGWLFRNGDEPIVPEIADVDGSGSVTVGDVTYLVAYLFRGGPEPICPPDAKLSENPLEDKGKIWSKKELLDFVEKSSQGSISGEAISKEPVNKQENVLNKILNFFGIK